MIITYTSKFQKLLNLIKRIINNYHDKQFIGMGMYDKSLCVL